MGDKASPVYLPASTYDPVSYTGLRATGLRAMLPFFSPEQPDAMRTDNAVRDVGNVALGTLGPFARGLQTAFTGTQPYMQADGTFLRVAPKHFSGNVGGQIATALGLANPAVHAFASSSGDAGRTLASAMEQEGKPMGGAASFLAKVAEFTMPRVLAPSIGGRTNEQSADVQLDRRRSQAMGDYAARIRRTNGADAKAAIITEAADDARRAGFDPDAVVVALEKVAAEDKQSVAEKKNQQMQRRVEKTRLP